MSEMITTIHDAKTHLSKYLIMLENNEIEKLIIKRRDREIGELTFRSQKKPKHIFGILKNEINLDEKELREGKKQITDLMYKNIGRRDENPS
ncbi:MAG: type II toxin-antitoxin system Phd/YefM family antitoxin [Bdellovibrionales bacterium]